jgi:Leucine-rich repeat (LRR) protein
MGNNQITNLTEVFTGLTGLQTLYVCELRLPLDHGLSYVGQLNPDP